ncbi:MAG: hypothetical protein CMK60_14045 [Proteobacteria bacterium]|jgi:endonuclease/exonuclease/phosphatase family metal-dependent hydrolase|nr:hypothetical protein [Pseudomonadota bacterium]MBP10083.1 hypothetical protein [Acidiferrobacteraceae bacterium]MDP6137723.1 endonuclease/exonuclease/phosphatase family protein [Arenicellales bacterium]MDP7218257.1 endonuclease/exonuclease/phosphatase family protein [Arenicellales bacterium]HJP11920.1 endonuclease/exonuclease/phosphatase family protein [Arenicellales bacterium]|tara:strand:- start:279 stop:1025 length:747 start_codon:yes stop_codon:yes gene_type:complete
MKIRIITYNIHKCIGGVDRRYAPARIAEVIAHYGADLVLLQEVANRSPRSGGDRQVDLLGELLGFRHRAWFPNVRLRGGGEYGNGVLSHWRLTASENVDLTIAPKKRRSVLHVRIRVPVYSQKLSRPRSRTIHLFNAHLGLSGIERRMQLKRLLNSTSVTGISERIPLVIAGDLNDIWGMLGRLILHPAGFQGSQGTIRTFPAYTPVRPLDGFYVKGDLELLNLMPSRLKLARLASDHLPLVADLLVH